MSKKVLVLGLDCAPPALVFERLKNQLPNLNRLMNQGSYGVLRSVTPPITSPAWMCMMTSKDPGTLGVYGFRHRRIGTYDDFWISNSTSITEKKLWEILAEQGKKVVLLGVPMSYPPSPVNGIMVTDFLAPDTQADYTYPLELKKEIADTVGEYMLDVSEFRTDRKIEALKEIYVMTEKRFALARHFMKTKPWDFFMMVEMGPDRLHHAFWKCFDPEHPQFKKGNPFENVALAYYKYLDGEIGKLLEHVDEHKTTILVVSDHGAKKTKGNFCINEWLIREGLLVLKEPVTTSTKINDAPIDWSKTRAWAWGGYYARVFFNVQGREPQGVIPASEYETFRTDLIAKLQAVPDEHGKPMKNLILRPEEAYRQVNRDYPDLLAFFDDLEWRPIAPIGNGKLYTQESDIGPDDAVHDWNGIVIVRDPAHLGNGHRLDQHSLLDIAPTILEQFGLPVPSDMQGRSIPLL